MTDHTTDTDNPILLAFSGGLDTSFAVPWLRETYDRPVVTLNINTGGLDEQAVVRMKQRALSLGAVRHVTVDARDEYYDRVLRYLVYGNVKRGQAYPLCVGAERSLQAQRIATLADEFGASSVAHGCTAAGNDQVRFEVALRTLNPKLEVLAPIRDNDFQRMEQIRYLEARGLPIPAGRGEYSINRGLWGISIGGKETLDSNDYLPERAWVLTKGAFDGEVKQAHHTLSFEKGVPTALDGEAMSPVDLIEKLEIVAGEYGIGRGMHVGDTILGTKGRVAYEAPAAEVILLAHRELEKLTLTPSQLKLKEPLSITYGDLVHEGQHLDPVCRDIEALLASSQERVTGEVRMLFRTGTAIVEGITSPHSLMAASGGVYGETAGEWSAADATGLSRMRALPGMLHTRAA